MSDLTRSEKTREAIRALLLTQREARGPGLSICPTQVAQRIDNTKKAGQDPEGWRRNLPLVRRVAVEMAQGGEIAITRKGKPVDPEKFKGVYRLAWPISDDGEGQSSDE